MKKQQKKAGLMALHIPLLNEQSKINLAHKHGQHPKLKIPQAGLQALHLPLPIEPEKQMGLQKEVVHPNMVKRQEQNDT